MTNTLTMKALVLDKPNAPCRLADVPRPVPGPGQVLVRITASGVNPLDTKIRAGEAAHAQHALPAILGIDLAGVVEQIGPGVGHGEILAEAAKLVEAGKLIPSLDPRRFDLTTVADAHAAITNRTATGKLVVSIG